MSISWRSHLSRLEAILEDRGVEAVLEVLEDEAESARPGSAQQATFALVREAIQLDASFLTRHPRLLFQCLWNRCWWLDAPEVDLEQPLHALMESWRSEEEPRRWLRSLRPPRESPGSGLLAQHPADVPPGSGNELLQQAVAALELSDRDTATSPTLGLQAQSSENGSSVTNVDSGEVLFELTFEDPGEIGNPCGHLFSPSGRWLAVRGWLDEYEGRVCVWEFAFDDQGRWTGAPPKRVARWYDLHEYNSASFSEDERLLVLTGDSHVEFIDTGTWQVTRRWRHRAGRVAPLGDHVVCIEQGWLRVWDMDRAEQSPLRPHPQESVGDPVFSPGGTRLLTLPWLWDGNTGEPIARLDISSGGWLEGGPPSNGIYVGDRRIICLDGTQFQVWDARTGEPEPFPSAALEHFFTYLDVVAYSQPAGAQLALTRRFAQAVELLPIDQEAPPQMTVALPSTPTHLCFAASRPLLATACGNGDVLVIETTSGEIVWRSAGHPEAGTLGHRKAKITGVVFSSDDSRLVSAGTQEKLRVWDVDTGECLADRGLGPFVETSTPQIWTSGPKVPKDGPTTIYWVPTPESVEALDGWCGFRAPRQAPRWSAAREDHFLCIRDAETQTPVAHYPTQDRRVAQHPDGGIWAGESFHIVLEVARRQPGGGS